MFRPVIIFRFFLFSTLLSLVGCDAGAIDAPDVPTEDQHSFDDKGAQSDTALPDFGPITGNSLAFGENCIQNNDCKSGFCVPTTEGPQCSAFCVDSCEEGWICRDVALVGNTSAQICVDPEASLCRPCNADSDCTIMSGKASDSCVNYGDYEGSFCASTCTDQSECPSGYVCNETIHLETGETISACVSESHSCTCLNIPSFDHAYTDCGNSHCTGLRECFQGSLSACDAQASTDESCDGIDNNCNGIVDEDLGDTICGVGSCEHSIPNCVDGSVQECDPMEGSSEEICDGHDNDCDGSTDEDFLDTDNDGIADCTDKDDDGDDDLDETDCAPLDASIYTGAPESCDEIDSNCNESLVDLFPDTDGDLSPDCIDLDDDGDGTPDTEDCAPLNPDRYPGALESCDGIDSNCNDSLVDEFNDLDTDGLPDCVDDDDDGDGDPDLSDCDPQNPLIFNGAFELCDDIDSNCDGDKVDGDPNHDGDDLPDCADDDDDNDGDPDTEDCAPMNNSIYHGQMELCDLIDSDCDGDKVDEFPNYDGDELPDCADDDDDNDGDPDTEDCQPNNGAIFHGQLEACDLLDSDCDGDFVDGYPNTDGDMLPDCSDAAPSDPNIW